MTPPGDKVSLRTRAAVGGALIGAFMAVLNTQLVNTSLPDIQGGIGTGLENGGWVSTAYLVGEIIVIPLSYWLAEVFSMRRYLIANTILFLVFSVACGLAVNFPQMVLFRAAQGFTGGVLIPLAMVCVLTMLPMRERPMGFALFSLSATFAPAIGPTIGGAITDFYGWRYIFFLNLVPGAVMLGALAWGLKPAPMQLQKFRQGDWSGIAAMALGLAALQIVLEEGNKDDWFSSSFILRLSVIAVISLAAFLFLELRRGNMAPVVNLRLFAQWNFSLATIGNILLGFVLYAALYMIPVYLAEAHGYSAAQSGMVLLWIGLPQLVLIPCTPWLMRRIDVRLLLFVAFACFAISTFMNMNLGPDDSGPQLLIPDLIRALGQAVVFPAISMVATAGIPLKDVGSASSLFNMLRNLGGAIGIALVQTFVTNREKFHSAIITPSVSLLAPATRSRIALLQHYFQAHGLGGADAARHQAILAIGRTVATQASYFAYGDAFAMLGVCMTVASIVTLFLKKPKGSASPGAH